MTDTPDIPALVERLNELRAKATPGPWLAERTLTQSLVLHTGRAGGDGYNNRVAACPQWDPAAAPRATPSEAATNAELIATLVNAYPTLADALTRLQAENERLRERLHSAELALAAWDEGCNSEYWLRHPDALSLHCGPAPTNKEPFDD